jgi:hypothetical protein
VISGAYGAIPESVLPAAKPTHGRGGPIGKCKHLSEKQYLVPADMSRNCRSFRRAPGRARLKPHWARKAAALRDALKQRRAYGRQSRRRARSAHRQRSADLRARAATDKPQKEKPSRSLLAIRTVEYRSSFPCASRSGLLENTARASSHCSELLGPPSNRLNLAVNFWDGICRFSCV